jgi:hypothetical protein
LRKGKNIEDEKEDKIQDMETKKIFEKKMSSFKMKNRFSAIGCQGRLKYRE